MESIKIHLLESIEMLIEVKMLFSLFIHLGTWPLGNERGTIPHLWNRNWTNADLMRRLNYQQNILRSNWVSVCSGQFFDWCCRCLLFSIIVSRTRKMSLSIKLKLSWMEVETETKSLSSAKVFSLFCVVQHPTATNSTRQTWEFIDFTSALHWFTQPVSAVCSTQSIASGRMIEANEWVSIQFARTKPWRSVIRAFASVMIAILWIRSLPFSSNGSFAVAVNRIKTTHSVFKLLTNKTETPQQMQIFNSSLFHDRMDHGTGTYSIEQ